MSALFETARLIGRDFEPDRDAEAAFAIYGDPEVTQWIGGDTAADVPAMRERLTRARTLFDGRGAPFCLAACELRETGALVGAGLLKRLPDAQRNDTDDVEVGWHLARAFWGHGYATEIGRAVIARGFAHLDVDRLHAVVDPGNERSERVAERCGMRRVGRTEAYYGKSLWHYVIERDR